MLHGHTKIELKNEKTGEIQVVEKDNMITNALQYFLEDLSKSQSLFELNRSQLPMYDKCLGGIILMSETQTEDADNISIPLLDKITGYASNNVNSESDTKRGSKNLTESKLLDNGYQYVWDFTTSQANGEIASLGLTHYLAGANPKQKGSVSNILGNNIAIKTSDNIATYINNFGVDLDSETGIITCIETLDINSLKITKYKLPTYNTPLSIRDIINSPILISESTITLSSNINANLVWKESDDNYYYGIYILNRKSIEIYRINKTNFQVDTDFHITKTTSDDFGFNLSKSSTNSRKHIAIYNNYIYMIGGYDYTCVKLNLADVNDIIEKKLKLNMSASVIIFNNIIHYGIRYIDLNLTTWWDRNTVSMASQNGNFFTGEKEYSTEIFVKLNKAGVGYTVVASDTQIYMYFGVVYDYLATINNLDTPVTKTSEQSMKITYTITEE
nr:MAG TPA: hypothetical protein [Caudoviricetes sp.]